MRDAALVEHVCKRARARTRVSESARVCECMYALVPAGVRTLTRAWACVCTDAGTGACARVCVCEGACVHEVAEVTLHAHLAGLETHLHLACEQAAELDRVRIDVPWAHRQQQPASASSSHERWSTVGLHCLMGPVGSTRRGLPPSHGSVAAVRPAAAALINTPKP